MADNTTWSHEPFRASSYLTFPPHAANRVAVTSALYAKHVLPVYVCYYAAAVLVQMPRTRVFRVALLPVTLCLAWIAGVAFDLSSGDPKYNFLSFGQCLGMVLIAMRVTDWAFVSKPLRREPPSSPYLDAVDLMCNMRGIDWSFSSSSSIPPHPSASLGRLSFAVRTLAYGLLSLAIFDGAQHIIQAARPTTLGHPDGGTIFNPSLPLTARYIDALETTLLSGLVFYLNIETVYSTATLVGLALGSPPRRWPPFSTPPWRATSIARFWGRAWHQTFRRPFFALGGAPLRAVLGPPGMWLGAFGASAVFHDWTMWGMGDGVAGWRTQTFFWAMGGGCAVEYLFSRATGRRVGGAFGWVWTMCWTLGWGTLFVDGYLRKGLEGSQIVPEPLRLGKAIVEVVRGWSR